MELKMIKKTPQIFMLLCIYGITKTNKNMKPQEFSQSMWHHVIKLYS